MEGQAEGQMRWGHVISTVQLPLLQHPDLLLFFWNEGEETEVHQEEAKGTRILR